ncbi:arsenate reductase ArsC [Thiobacillus sp. 0-1251]|uniref:arsenate reductase ArsC n=1 Tax=Thiobacillus sp. 0-1251 TaxID=1895858 RepID=UPI0009618032|nr:arsenate reductase ArsC [Thiobacillus sp. 0-1251]OJY54886.1 MAG: protein-tyrosine-phosphatase [Thiobacillus sp. 0-1251]
MAEPVFNVLFLCTGNSARSILAESLLNQLGKGRFRAFSAGSRPVGRVNPFALELLEKNHFPTGELRSKSWDEFAQPDAPPLDFVVTVCDNAAGEVCPVWPAQPMTAHWGIPDPTAVEGNDDVKRHAFVETMSQLQRRLSAFVSLPFHTLDNMKLQQAVRDIGRTV